MGERFHRGILEFNRGYFFKAHDILEDLWKAISKITPYEPVHHGLAVDDLLREVRRCLDHVEQSAEADRAAESGQRDARPFEFPTIKYIHHQIPPVP